MKWIPWTVWHNLGTVDALNHQHDLNCPLQLHHRSYLYIAAYQNHCHIPGIIGADHNRGWGLVHPHLTLILGTFGVAKKIIEEWWPTVEVYRAKWEIGSSPIMLGFVACRTALRPQTGGKFRKTGLVLWLMLVQTSFTLESFLTTMLAAVSFSWWHGMNVCMLVKM